MLNQSADASQSCKVEIFAVQQRCTWVAAPCMPDLRRQRSSRASVWKPPTSAWRSPWCAASVLLRPVAASMLTWAPAWQTAGCSEADTRSAAHALDAARRLLWLRMDELGEVLNAPGVWRATCMPRPRSKVASTVCVGRV